MEKYDIVGRAKNNVLIYAQVKADWKNHYKSWFNDVNLPQGEVVEKILFADEQGKNKKLENDVKFISIQEVFEYFNHATGQKMLMDMSGLSKEYQGYLELI